MVLPFIVGRRVLDLGGGEGYVAAALRRRTDARVCAVDVGPSRRASAPYVSYDGVRLPFPAGVFDTTLLLLTCTTAAIPTASSTRLRASRAGG